MPQSAAGNQTPAPAAVETPENWLIVDQSASPPPRFEELLELVKAEFQLDPYTVRQRIIGCGYTLFARGRSARLEQLFGTLRRFGVPCQLIAPQRPTSSPQRLRELKITPEAVILQTEGATLTVDQQATVVAVLADLSGAAVEKNLKRLLVRNAYQGINSVAPTAQQSLVDSILRAQPILDLYLLNREDASVRAVRAFPARFDASGLGDRKTPSAALNLRALLEAVGERAGALSLRADFGLANLPGCQLQRGADNSTETANLAALTRFGNLAVAIVAAAAAEPPEDKGGGSLVGQAGLSPELAAVAAVAGLSEDEEAVSPAPVPPVPPLPPPPQQDAEAVSGIHVAWSDWIGGGLGLLCWLFGMFGRGSYDHVFWRFGFAYGGFFAAAAGFCLWRGWHYLRLKRTVENTPVSRIRSLATGMVEVSGRAIRRYALVAPMTQLPCVYYQLSRYRRDSKDHWRLTSRSASGPVPFLVEDATGAVLVNPRRCHLRPGVREEGFGGGGGISQFLSGPGSTSDEKWVEEVIPEGATVYVLGFANLKRERRASLTERTAEKLRNLKGSRELLERFDRDGDGRIDQHEWDEARRAIEDEASHDLLAGNGERRRQEEYLEIGPPPRRSLPFIVAQSPDEEELLRSFSLRIFAFFAAAGVLIGWTCWQLVMYLSPYSR